MDTWRVCYVQCALMDGQEEGMLVMMKLLFAVVGCFAVLTASAAEAKMDKRYMEGKAAVQK